jgi:2-oxoisovalerate dehydrogenase E1 component
MGPPAKGDFHESVNTAAVWDLPVIIIIENNGYGLSTPSSEQFRMKSFTATKPSATAWKRCSSRATTSWRSYNNLREVAESIRENPRPILVECMTFRMRGHEEASGTKYVPKELFETWGKKDPVPITKAGWWRRVY